MGLVCSHDAFSGSYSRFNRFRTAIAKCMGGSWPPHDDKLLDDEYWYPGDKHTKKTSPGLYELMSHSDCDGNISPKKCKEVADDLEKLLPEIENYKNGEYVETTKRFIVGCRHAHAKNESLRFG